MPEVRLEAADIACFANLSTASIWPARPVSFKCGRMQRDGCIKYPYEVVN